MKEDEGDAFGGGRGSMARALRMETPLPRKMRRRTGARAVIEGSGLSAGLKAVVAEVVARTRLWRGEKEDVARELVAHFEDGLKAGWEEEQLVGDFGERERAAALIRRAKRRNRPLWWRVMHRARQGVVWGLGVCAAVWCVLAVRYFSGSPTISRNITAELNAATLALLEEERAWTHYRAALLRLAVLPAELQGQSRWPMLEPDDPQWALAEEHNRACAGMLEGVRLAAAMDRLGWVLGDEHVEHELTRHLYPKGEIAAGVKSENPLLIGVVLPHIGWMRMVSKQVVSDTRVAAMEGDSRRVRENIVALLGIARHVRENGIMMMDLASLALVAMAQEQIRWVVEQRPGLLGPGDLSDLSHRLAAFADGEQLVRLGSERLMFEDVVQRAYTDDGFGDGRLTHQGLTLMWRLNTLSNLFMPNIGPKDRFALFASGPVIGAMTPGRRRALEKHGHLMAEAAAWLAVPLWERTANPTDARLEYHRTQWISHVRFPVETIGVPALGSLAKHVNRAEMTREGALVGMALEVHRLRHGGYPERLEDLVPRLLPAVPVDRFDGQPIRYRLVEGRPVVYSVGVDRKDDGGREAKAVDGSNNAWSWKSREELDAMREAGHGRLIPDGDAVVWSVAER